MSRLVVVTHNIEQALARASAGSALAAVLDRRPDAVGLQEWYPSRWALLRGGGAYAWSPSPLGGCVVGISPVRFSRLSSRVHLLSLPGSADRGEGRLGLEPARVAMVVRCRDRATGRLIAFIGFHLVHGVQLSGAYRRDRPRLVSRHQREVERLSSLVRRLTNEGYPVVAMGDSNFTGLRIPGLASAWTGRESAPGTLGSRHVDDVFAPAAPSSMSILVTESDHRAVVAEYDDPGGWA